MQWVIDNWVWLLLGGGMIAMHLFGHGSHGKNRDSGSRAQPQSQERAPLAAVRAEKRLDL